MHITTSTAFAALLAASTVSAQTFTKCNPLQQTCPPDTALGRSMTAEFTSESSDFTGTGGSISYGSDGAALTINSAGQAPTLESNWYIMFGRVDVTMKSAPGTGIVSSFVMQSDDLDEIDLEWLGGDSSQVQSNYFSKGQTGGYDRGAFHPDANNQGDFKTYSVVWTSTEVTWAIDGQAVRVLTAAQAGSQYPQTPMQIKVGIWAGGAAGNSQGTIDWAGGNTDFSAGPFTMYVKSIAVTDYSTGTQYKYGDNSGTWGSIVAVGGSVGTGGSGDNINTSNMPSSSVTSGQPVPFSGTHAEPSSTFVTPTVYPWVGTASTASPCYTGRPDGWTCSANGKLLPPSAGSQSPPVSTSPPSQASQSAAPSSGGDRSSITGAPEPVVTKIPPMNGASANATSRATPSTALPTPTEQQLAPVSTGAAMRAATSRLSTALGVVAVLAFWL